MSSALSSDQTIVSKLRIEGMHCPACAARVTKALTALAGVESATVSLEHQQATVTYRPGAVTLTSLQQAVTDAGYTVLGVES